MSQAGPCTCWPASFWMTTGRMVTLIRAPAGAEGEGVAEAESYERDGCNRRSAVASLSRSRPVRQASSSPV